MNSFKVLRVLREKIFAPSISYGKVSMNSCVFLAGHCIGAHINEQFQDLQENSSLSGHLSVEHGPELESRMEKVAGQEGSAFGEIYSFLTLV